MARHSGSNIGLISDTHAPDRCKELPKAIFDGLTGVDLILHAGDAGELWVLDQLSTIAPVIAVHDNDETAEAKAARPYLQSIAVAGQWIVLIHSHDPACVTDPSLPFVAPSSLSLYA